MFEGASEANNSGISAALAITHPDLRPTITSGPTSVTSGDLFALRWFVEERGGVAVLIPDQVPSGRYLELLGTPRFEREST